ncbi:MAG: hypothetical protein RMK01_03615 [Thermomicrobium sp.]|nr:hypothetical protein [Thermomicrobium sp.]MDW8059142.1 hypothetical protein [Thermomicrobium sp.]
MEDGRGRTRTKRSGACRFRHVLWLAVLLGSLLAACRGEEPLRTAVYLVEPGQLVALDPVDGRELLRVAVPLGWACDIAVSPDGRWVAVVQGTLVLVPTQGSGGARILDPPDGWHVLDCLQSSASAEIPWALARWADDVSLLVLVRRSSAGREVRALTAFDTSEGSWRPWTQELVVGCWLLEDPTPEFQLSCERFPDPTWPPTVAGLLGIDPVNGIIQRRVPLIPPEPLRRLGVPFGSPVVGIVEVEERAVALAESGLLLLFGAREDEASGIVLWQAAGLTERASGKALQVAPDRRVVWAVLWRNDGRPALVLVDLLSRSVARVVELDGEVSDLDLLPDGTAVLVRETPRGRELVRRDLRTGRERSVAVLPVNATCCWVGPLAGTAD